MPEPYTMPSPPESPNMSRPANRLARESSPYLLQHAHNPVDWYSWGPEAFAASRRQDKPIFLSVGYSTCYWCHVMERQCFENERIAAEMNRRCINIKVDREQRPDVDQLYMTAVQILTHHGGWPMSVFLTPDLRPFYGGTYFPPTDQQDRPGFLTVLAAVCDAYRARRHQVDLSATQLVNILQQLAQPPVPSASILADRAWIDRLVQQSIGDYDPQHGGFGPAPRFPRQTLLQMLLAYTTTLAGNPTIARSVHEPLHQDVLARVCHTLDAMASGGIRDQLGGAFHRYSTDAQWSVPHFEIMLYDNALLAWVYVEAYRQTEQPHYAGVARGILDFVLREMRAPQGAFYTAIDAEADAREGATYLWTPGQVRQVLGAEDAKLFNRVYGLDRGPNFADPHGGPNQPPGANVLYVAQPVAEVAASIAITTEQLEQRLSSMRERLYAARRVRPQPMLDRKVITGWNALMIRALAYAGQILDEPRYIDAAVAAARYVLAVHRTADGELVHSSGGGLSGSGAGPSTVTTDVAGAPATPRPAQPAGQPPLIHGFLDDYVLMIQALLALRDATGADEWKDLAALLGASLLHRFGDGGRGGFFYTDAAADDLIVRQKTGSDAPLPSGNALAAIVMLALDRPDVARRTLAAFAAQMDAAPESMSAMLEAALHYVRRHGAFTLAADPRAAAADRPLSPQQLAEGVVSVRPQWTSPTCLNLHLTILAGFHINAHEPASGLVPTELSIDAGPPASAVRVEYPTGTQRQLASDEHPHRVYEGSVVLSVQFTDPPPAGPLRLLLRYQACDADSCLPPVTRDIEVPAFR